MDTGTTNEIKKGNLEDLSKEELVKKCKGFLSLLQKAKQVKYTIQEENNELKTKLAQTNASEEIVESLTKQKLSLVMTIEDLKTKNSSLDSKLQIYEEELRLAQEKLNSADTENVSLKRQVTRLTDENEQLISHLESLEKQIDELNKIGIQQREQLLELERSKLEETTSDSKQVPELQNMLRVSLEEVKKLKTENNSALEKVNILQINLSEKDNNLLTISNELKLKCDTLGKITKELDDFKNIKENKDLEDTNEIYTKNIEELQNVNTRLKDKLKLYHSKLVKFAGNAKALKEEKNEILRIFKLYTDQVKDWKEQLNTVGQKLVTQVNEVETENKCLKEIEIQNVADIEDLKKENKDLLEKIKIILQSEEASKNKIQLLSKEKENIANKLEEIITKFDNDTKILIDQNEKENAELKNKLKDSEKRYTDISTEVNSLKNELDNAKRLNDELQATFTESKLQLTKYEYEINKLQQQDTASDKKIIENEVNLRQTVNNLQDELNHSKTTEKQLAEKSSEEIVKLVKENRVLLEANTVLQQNIYDIESHKDNLQSSESQTSETFTSVELNDQLVNLKRENVDLLREMNEMNQALKERGEAISKLEAHCEEIMKKLQIYESQANKNVDSITEKEEIINNLTNELELLKSNNPNTVSLEHSEKDQEILSLKQEIQNLKENLNGNLDNSYAESEAMSTSTISRTEEGNRLKDLEGSWEERYGKLRSLALKLKGKIREQTQVINSNQLENEEMQKKLSMSLKTIQTLQAHSGKLEEDLDKTRQESKQFLNRLNTVGEDISKDKQLLVSNEDVIGKLKREIEELKSEKQSTENWKKQVSAKVQTLRKELEANNVLKKEYESKLAKLTADLEAKDKAFTAEIESHKQTKSLLDQSNNECKKNSVLNLEMQDYERSVKELSQKLDKKTDQITNLQTQIDSQKSTINALREQNKLLEERIQNEERDVDAATTEINNYKKKISNLEDIIEQQKDKILSITQLLEISRSENEELSTELSKVIAEHQKSANSLKSERDQIRSQTLGLQQSLREVQDTLNLREDELKTVKTEYEGYKVRAQSVLRQNQNRDVGLEEKLSEENTTLKAQNDVLNKELKKLKEETRDLKNKNEKLLTEVDDHVKKSHDLESEVKELKSQYDHLYSKHQRTLNEHAETVRSLKVHAETLSQCYRQQISEQEVRHNREIIELQSRLDKAPSPAEPAPLHPSMPREEGEGSESIESNPPSVYPVPLERLLGSDSDQEVTYMKKQLFEQEAKVAHLTELLSDTEQDLAKHVQMNKLLKEEIRRQQRSVEREKHAENLEYLKNVIFKFVTLNSGDERTRLVPVLNTILKLSPEETQKLTLVAKGDPGMRGWANYLPMWSSPSKPL